MELISIIIMLLGIAVLIALYFMSKSARADMPKEKDIKIQEIRGEDGRLASSIKDDIPGKNSPVTEPDENAPRKVIKETQFALFIAATDENGMDCNRLLEVFDHLGLEYGDMSLFHRMVLADGGESSLYKIANGVEPWTLNPDDIKDTMTPGLSIVMDLPSPVDDAEAIDDFVVMANRIASAMDATLMNSRQEVFNETDKAEMLALVG
jgi:cell division protein ZipA